MIKHAVALRYAKALFTVDMAAGTTQKRCQDFQYVLKLFADHPKLMTLIAAPQITPLEKETLLGECLKEINDPVFLRFLFYAMKKGRLNYLKEIYAQYQIMADGGEGIWEGKLISGVPMAAPTLKKLAGRLERFYGKKVVFNEVIDPQVVGGTLLIVGNRAIDWSVESRTKKIKENLLSTHI
jgi:F-type H+-transporting ATPase subunit delta